MIWTSGPAILVALAVFGIKGLSANESGDLSEVAVITDLLESKFTISPWLLLVPVASIALIVLKLDALAAMGLGTLAGAVAANFVLGYVNDRFANWYDAFNEDRYNEIGGSYQLVQGLFGLAHGGVIGTGLGQGLPYITPVSQSDYIVASLGEELGLAGLFAILCLYMILTTRGLRIGYIASDEFSKLLATGLAFVIALQCFIVIGGVTRVIPLTGLTTPFLAAGGSSLVANWIIIALLLRLSDAARSRTRLVVA
jgi:cell division protein FtsW (lipid II flippase)